MTLNEITRLDYGPLQLPDWHPRHADRTCPNFGFAITTGDGIIVFDTGCGTDSTFINDHYSPSDRTVIAELHACRLDERDVIAIVNSHLHFDHCGQNALFPTTPIWVQAAEREAARAEFYTVPEWADVDSDRLKIAGDHEAVADGVTIVATPGHTPGHQSLVVETVNGIEVVAGQACYTCADYAARHVDESDVHDAEHLAAAYASLDRLDSFDPIAVHLGHDARSYSPTSR